MHSKESDVSYLATATDKYWSDKYFQKGWARRQQHGKTKGHTYMTEAHRAMITKYFEDGEHDKGKKMSAAGMVREMYYEFERNETGQHPHKQHYIPFVSEVNVVVNQCSTKKKKKSNSVRNSTPNISSSNTNPIDTEQSCNDKHSARTNSIAYHMKQWNNLILDR